MVRKVNGILSRGGVSPPVYIYKEKIDVFKAEKFFSTFFDFLIDN